MTQESHSFYFYKRLLDLYHFIWDTKHSCWCTTSYLIASTSEAFFYLRFQTYCSSVFLTIIIWELPKSVGITSKAIDGNQIPCYYSADHQYTVLYNQVQSSQYFFNIPFISIRRSYFNPYTGRAPP